MPPTQPALLGKLQASYALTEADYGAGDLDGTWVVHLVAMLDGLLRPLQPLLTPGAWEGVFHALLDKVGTCAPTSRVSLLPKLTHCHSACDAGVCTFRSWRAWRCCWAASLSRSWAACRCATSSIALEL